jgi:hypothetical protein
MRLFVLITALLAFECYAKDYQSCDVHASKNVALYVNGKQASIKAAIKGTPCYEAQLEINVIVAGKVAYSYKAPFKPHVAIQWDVLTEQDAKKYLKSIFESYHLINCGDLLPSKLDTVVGWDYNNLLVPLSQYEKYKASKCKAFIHQTHYESYRAIVFPANSTTGVIVSEYGL